MANNSQLSLEFVRDQIQATDEPGSNNSTTTKPVRIIHYLGSKLRLLKPIQAALDAVVKDPGATICDLFAGSGVVGVNLGKRWNILAADIQEYSRVICSAALNGRPPAAAATGQEIVSRARSGQLRGGLRGALGNLLTYEKSVLRRDDAERVTRLCDLLERGSLLVSASSDKEDSSELGEQMRLAFWGLQQTSLATGPESVVTRHFGGVYFSWEQAIDLDALLSEVHKQHGPVRDFFLAAVLSVASNVVNTVGKQFAQPIKPRDSEGRPKNHLIKQTLRDRSMDVFEEFGRAVDQLHALDRAARTHRTVRADFLEVLGDRSLHFDAVYADPPYTRDHYSRYYHVLETMARHDDPTVSTSSIRNAGEQRISRGIYRADRYQSRFCIKSKAPRAFEDLCSGVSARRIPLVMSYSPYVADNGNRPRLLTVDEVSAIASKYFNRVDTSSVDAFSHNKLNLVAKNRPVDYAAEVLLVCQP